jgi:phospholipid transport system substrate-binding protein
MLTRRFAMLTLGAGMALISSPWRLRHAFAQAGDKAVAFVQSTSDQLVEIANSALPPAERRLRPRRGIDTTVDIDDIAHFCHGRFWRLATPEQQNEYMVLFHHFLVTEISRHLGEYNGVRVTMGLARASADTEIVMSAKRPTGSG